MCWGGQLLSCLSLLSSSIQLIKMRIETLKDMAMTGKVWVKGGRQRLKGIMLDMI